MSALVNDMRNDAPPLGAARKRRNQETISAPIGSDCGIIGALPGAAAYLDVALCIVNVNATAASWFRRPVKSLTGVPAHALFDHAQSTEIYSRLEPAGFAGSVSLQCALEFPDGKHRVVLVDCRPHREGEDVIGYVLQLRDISSAHRAQSTLRQANQALESSFREASLEARRRNTALKRENAARRRSEERYRIVSELMSDLIYVYRIDADGKMRAVWFTGRLSKEFAPRLTEGGHYRVWRPIVHPDDDAILDARIERLMNNESSIDEFRVIDREGMTRWLRVFGEPIYDEAQRRVTRIMVAAQDITETKVAEKQLEQHRFMLAEALSSMSDGFLLFDRRGKLVEFNEKVLDLFPKSAPLIVKGARFEQILRHSVDAGEIKSVAGNAAHWIRERLEGFPSDHGAWEVELADGRWVLATDRPTSDGGVVGIRTDITERKRADEQRRMQEAELAQLLRRASMGEMASALAHEISQPLATIVNYASGLLRRLETGEADATASRNALQNIRDAGQRAKEIVNHVGDFVRLGTPQVKPESVRLIVREVVDLLAGALARNTVALATDLPDDDVRVCANRIEIEQVLFNLLRNGIDSIEASGALDRRIEIECRLEEPGYCQISVADSGAGVDRAVRDSLFEPYVTTKSQGLGMGLSISRTIVEAHGGRLWVEADRAVGARFVFRLPVAPDDAV